MFIHSFVTWIYIAPLQGYYSEALPTLAWLKTAVLRVEYNASKWTLGSNHSANGSPFQTERPTTKNTWGL